MKKRITAAILSAVLLVPCAAFETTVSVKAESSVPVYRFYNTCNGAHFFTADENAAAELKKRGWQCEGTAWYAPCGGQSVYAVFNPNTDEYVYTADGSEKDYLAAHGWVYAGTTWASDPSRTYPVYRIYNPNASANSHFYTMSVNEKNALVRAGWRDEGIVWYVSGKGVSGAAAGGNPTSVRTSDYWPLNDNLSGSITIPGMYSARLETGSQPQAVVDKADTAYIADSDTYELGRYINWEISDHNGQGFDCIINAPIGQTASVTWRGIHKTVHLRTRHLMYNDPSSNYEHIYDENHVDHFDYNEGSIVMITCDYTRANYEWITYWD